MITYENTDAVLINQLSDRYRSLRTETQKHKGFRSKYVVHARGTFVLMCVIFLYFIFWGVDYTSSHVLDDVSKQWKILEFFDRHGRLK